MSEDADVSNVPVWFCVSVRESWISRTNTVEQIKNWDYVTVQVKSVSSRTHNMFMYNPDQVITSLYPWTWPVKSVFLVVKNDTV